MMESWGRTLRYNSEVIQPLWLSGEIADSIKRRKNLLPYGQGRSYGDVCLNDGGISIHTGNLNHVMAFNRETGVIRCEAGITLAEILSVCVPSGWFLPVTPGTKYVSLGGAIANDVHGKNQHDMGTFGCHLKCFQLVRSDGIYFCSPDENLELYRSTIGGLGLTGLIAWAEFQLIPIESPYLDIETVVFDDLDDYFRLAEEKNRQCEYSIAWVGWPDKRRNVGVFMAGNHSASISPDELAKHRVKHPRLS
ncbi:MAG TPA: FAD-binding oxidoreductase, partial [Gammaproteobacteria bacterium]